MLSTVVGCLPREPAGHAPRSAAIARANRAACIDGHIRSIWAGAPIGAPECSGFSALDGFATADDQRRIQKVCERRQIRAILTGEAPTPFTLSHCAARAPESASIRRTCQAVSRAQGESLNAVQRAACGEYRAEELSAGRGRGNVMSYAEGPQHDARSPYGPRTRD